MVHQKMGPCPPPVLSHSSSEVNFNPFPFGECQSSLSPTNPPLGFHHRCQVQISFKGVFLEQWVMVGLEGRRIKGERLDIALDLGPGPLTRGLVT